MTKNKTLLVTAVVLGVLAVFLINSRFGDLEAKANPPTTSFYRAVVDIAPGQTLEAVVGDKRLRTVSSVPETFSRAYPDAVDSASFATWKKRTLARPIRTGEFLRFEDLEPFTTKEFSALVKRGHLAISIAVSAETAVAYLIAPRDRVDVYLVRMVIDAAGSGGRAAETEVVGSDLEVFAVDNLVQDNPLQPVQRFRGAAYRTVTLTGSPDQVSRLLRARAEGTLTLALRGSGER